MCKAIDGTVGVCAKHLESGRKIELHAHDSFPLASVVKLPIVLQVLYLYDTGKLSLDQMVEIHPEDLRPGRNNLIATLIHPGISLSIRNLMELMLVTSDNTAADVLLNVVGGPEAVNDRMQALHVRGIYINRSLKQVMLDRLGLAAMSDEAWSLSNFFKHFQAQSQESRSSAIYEFDQDQRDTAMPQAMVKLMECLHTQVGLSPESQAILYDHMKRCQTGENRLKGMLPLDTAILHKTGAFPDGITNDVGLIDLPDNNGHIAIAVFIKSSSKPTSDCEQVIAQIARSVYDYYQYTT